MAWEVLAPSRGLSSPDLPLVGRRRVRPPRGLRGAFGRANKGTAAPRVTPLLVRVLLRIRFACSGRSWALKTPICVTVFFNVFQGLLV